MSELSRLICGLSRALREQAYIRVLGGIKMFGNKRYINAAHLRPTKDINEVYFHALDCVASKLFLERGPVSATMTLFHHMSSYTP